MAHAAEMRIDVFFSTIERYSFSVILLSPAFINWKTSPSDIVLVVVERSLRMAGVPSSVISLKDLEYRKSPTRTLAAFPQTRFAEVFPLRVSARSITSSWRRLAVWMNSMMADIG